MSHRSLPTILLVENDPCLARAWRRTLQKGAYCLIATDIGDAEVLFATHPAIKLIVMDGCLGGRHLNTLDLIRAFRKTFSGPMIATASVSYFCDQMCIAGCNYRINSGIDIPKLDLPVIVKRLLEEMKSS